jgi:hypothetical protein
MKGSTFSLSIGVLAILIVVTSFVSFAQESTKEEKVKVSQLPAAVVEAIKSNCEKCVIDKATREIENGVRIYDFEFKSGQGEMDVAEDGFVIERETVVLMKDVPPAAMNAIRNGAAGGRIRQIVRNDVRAELKDGKIIKLDTPKYLYEADLVKGNQFAEIQVSTEGEVIEAPQWRKKGTKEN